MSEVLALSSNDVFLKNMELIPSTLKEYKRNPSLVKSPLSSLSFSVGLTPQKLLEKFIPMISAEKDLKELSNYASLGIDILEYLDKNMWRTELPEEFFFVFDRIKDTIEELYNSSEPWMRRSAIKMQIRISDVQADKRRFIEYVATEDKINEMARARKNQQKLQEEIIDV